MKDFNLIVTSICEEVKEIAHKLAQDTDLTLTEAEKLLRDTTRDWERRLMLSKSLIILMLKDISWLSEVKNLPVWECAKQAFGEHNETQVVRWVKTTESYLFDGNIKQVANRIRKLRKVNPQFRDEFETQANYFHKHEHRMQYRAFRRKGYHIGSGIVESACKHVVAERCKQAGMKWNKKGIDAILNWRCLLKNNSWERYWQSFQKAA